jgi:hypothetical protein
MDVLEQRDDYLDILRGSTIIPGFHINGHRFFGKVSVATLFQTTVDPRQADRSNKALTSREADTMVLRELINRRYTKSKADNAADFGLYLYKLVTNKINGIAKAISMFVPEQLQLVALESTGRAAAIVLPHQHLFVAYDGDTQLAGWYDALRDEPDDEPDKRELKKRLQQEIEVPLDITHGKPLEWGAQAYHDTNALGIAPDRSLALSMDRRDELTAIARDIITRHSAVLTTTFMANLTTPSDRKRGVRFAYSCIRQGVACAFFGINAGATMRNLSALNLPLVDAKRDVVEAWFAIIVDRLAGYIKEDNPIVTQATMFHAIAGLAHDAVKLKDAAEASLMLERRANLLEVINWSRGSHWEGVAGTMTRRKKTNRVTKEVTYSDPVLQLGGGRVFTSIVYKAITDPQDVNYPKIRIA